MTLGVSIERCSDDDRITKSNLTRAQMYKGLTYTFASAKCSANYQSDLWHLKNILTSSYFPHHITLIILPSSYYPHHITFVILPSSYYPHHITLIILPSSYYPHHITLIILPSSYYPHHITLIIFSWGSLK